MSTLSIQIEPLEQDTRRVLLGGRLDTHTWSHLESALEPVLAERPGMLLLDLQALEYISSAGLRSFFRARKQLAAHGGKVLVLHPQPQIRKVFELVKAFPLNEIFVSREELDVYLEAMQEKVREG